jgi:hypothetical protein
MSDWRRAALGVLPPRYQQSFLQRLEAALAELAPHVGVAGAGGSAESFEQRLSQALQAAGLEASSSDLEQLVAGISKGGAAGMAIAVVLATWIADDGDEVVVAFGSLAARPQVVLQQLWTPHGAPPVSGSDLGQIARMPPGARASAIISALRPHRPPS